MLLLHPPMVSSFLLLQLMALVIPDTTLARVRCCTYWRALGDLFRHFISLCSTCRFLVARVAYYHSCIYPLYSSIFYLDSLQWSNDIFSPLSSFIVLILYSHSHKPLLPIRTRPVEDQKHLFPLNTCF
ncbi:hypothetical protein GQ43DRAFT_115858 [Delitschia confertaspora ATCC 74209]|uniref:Secreted protein n=1 Tax=Delitschia confertaspora ATCC 74209 TaxID=1513339 RepID=A0A9P4JTF9_9PLEO|nr:hypothetical protein GQ43DRAFT_115858 [Delitschia confertaspora ATCC 74209]